MANHQEGQVRYTVNSVILGFEPSPGSQQYVQTILSSLPKSSLHLSTPVRAVQTTESGKILLTTADGKSEEFDHVIMATHTDTTLSILKEGGGVSAQEAKILGSFEWNRNEAVVHSDAKV
jgi:predicted NAD/FAD-binding protein